MSLRNRMEDMELVQLPRILDHRGNLSVIEQLKDVPFKIERAFWIYDVPSDSVRGGHAFRKTEEFIVALSGSFDVVLHDGNEEKVFHLNRSFYGVYVSNMIWRKMCNFSTNAIALVVASTPYEEDDYIMRFEDYLYEKRSSPISSNVTARLLKSPILWHIQKPSVYDCTIIDLPKFFFEEGSLTVAYREESLPFDIKRVFYLYDIPSGESRGAHAHKLCHQFLVAASGAFEVVLDDGKNKRTVLLNRPYYGLHVPPGIWAAEQGFSSGSVCLVLASELYDEKDYIRTYEAFQEYRQ